MALIDSTGEKSQGIATFKIQDSKPPPARKMGKLPAGTGQATSGGFLGGRCGAPVPAAETRGLVLASLRRTR